MKFLMILVTFAGIIQFANAQGRVSAIVGEWDVIYVTEGESFSKDLLEATKEAKTAVGNNHNIALLTFEAEGVFELKSIRDYSAGNESGMFVQSPDRKLVTRYVTTPNDFDEKKRAEVQKRKSSALYLEGDVFVLKTKNEIFYMKRIRQ